jgi:hypothetical protein
MIFNPKTRIIAMSSQLIDTADDNQPAAIVDVAGLSEGSTKKLSASPTPLPPLSALVTAVAVAACGGGGSGGGGESRTGDAAGGGSTATEPPPTPNVWTKAEAARLLQQGGFGGNRAEVDRVYALGSPAAWVDEQLAMQQSLGHIAWCRTQGWDPDKDLAIGK